MSRLRRRLDRLQPLFARGGRYERFGALFEMVDTLLYTPGDTTRSAPHVRDSIDLKRVMIFVVLASAPAVLAGVYSAGHQANLALATLGVEAAQGWRGAAMRLLYAGYDPGAAWDCMVHGLLYFLPVYAVTLLAGGLWEVVFAVKRNHEVNEGFLVTSWLFAATLPATIPLWQVALGISFGVVIGKEVFGGTGKNFLNPALVGRAFLFFAYPAHMSGDSIWVPVDAFSGATPLALAAQGGVEAISGAGVTWSDAFLGSIQGSMGETSALACVVGAVFLVYTRIASWRIMAGVLAGMICTALVFNAGAGAGESMASVPWYWHAVLGGFAFGLVFMATDPVSAAMTRAGKWVYGALIGVTVVLIRAANAAYPEGMMLAILLGNMFAPLIDWMVVQANVRRRLKRSG